MVNISNLNLTNASTTGQAAGQDLDLTTANGAIYMSGVATAVFENINITGTIADNGITGINVSNFQLNNSLITGAGDGAHESGIEFSNLSGTSSLTNTEIALSETNSLDIVNTDVNLNLTLNNVIFRDTQTSGIGEGGFQFRSFSSAAGTPTTNIDIIDSDFLRIRTQGIQVIAEDDSVVSVDITNSVIDSQTGIGAGIDINGNDTSTVRFNIIGNPTIRSSGGAAINITSFISANVMGRIANNTNINVYSQTPAGTGASGSGVRLLAQENSHLTVAVTRQHADAGRRQQQRGGRRDRPRGERPPRSDADRQCHRLDRRKHARRHQSPERFVVGHQHRDQSDLRQYREQQPDRHRGSQSAAPARVRARQHP